MIEQHADRHDDREHDQIEENGEGKFAVCPGAQIGANAVRVDGNEDHKEASHNGEDGHDDVLERVLFALFFDKDEKKGNIHGVDCDDWELGGVKAEQTEDWSGEIGTAEVEIPKAAEKKG